MAVVLPQSPAPPVVKGGRLPRPVAHPATAPKGEGGAHGSRNAWGLDLKGPPELKSPEFYPSHGALLLGYEQAMTREDSPHPGTFCGPPAHMLGTGARTRQPDHAHVEFCRGIMNPL